MKDIKMEVDIIKGGKSIYDNEYTTGRDCYSRIEDKSLDARDILTFKTNLFNFIQMIYPKKYNGYNNALSELQIKQYLYTIIQDIDDDIILSILKGDTSFSVYILADWLRSVYVDDYTPKGKDALEDFLRKQRRPK